MENNKKTVEENLYRDLGKRNKGMYWEYLSSYGFHNTEMPGTDYSIPLFLGHGRGIANNHAHNIGVIGDNIEIMKKEIIEGKYTSEFFSNIDNTYRREVPKVKQLCSVDFTRKSNEELAEIFDKVWRSMAEGNKQMLMGLMAQYLGSHFEEELKKVVGDDRKALIQATALLLEPTKLTLVQIEEELLLRFEEKFFREFSKKGENTRKEFLDYCHRPEIRKKLAELVDKTGWFHMEYYNDPWDEDKYVEHIWTRIKNKVFHNSRFPSERLKETKNKQDEFLSNYKNTSTLKNFAFALQELSYILDASKAVIVENRYRALGLYDEIAKRIGVSRKDLLNLLPPETIELLKKNKQADKELIKKRWDARAVWLHDGKIETFEGKEARELGQRLLEKPREQKDEAKGVIAYPGVVRGKVIIVHNVDHHKKFNEGDILVAHDVSTEFTSLLKKASAIVVDQGGIISHAAIVAREFKTPCVVGTGNASEIFKDGDYVEVDAENGIVKKLE